MKTQDKDFKLWLKRRNLEAEYAKSDFRALIIFELWLEEREHETEIQIIRQ